MGYSDLSSVLGKAVILAQGSNGNITTKIHDFNIKKSQAHLLNDSGEFKPVSSQDINLWSHTLHGHFTSYYCG